MRILHFNWAAFDLLAGIKYVTGVAIMLVLTAVVVRSRLGTSE